ncbi:GGDEF domain-containing protein [Shewanella sp. Isolate11]|uniref:diguanylate cyclase DgcS n=1 Tax=Shewanella sp. Isolate11 TaxID=2908530 RepID=UPI001EFCA492|nr:GGDEF domain-containing protein [Shewanella sp. Isolate11]MCG9696161.1 GGDEF domain-containing protein [Shewanella sp. Isolate11]
MDFALATEFSPSAYRYHSESHYSDKGAPNMVTILQQLHQSLDPRTVFACFGKIIGQYLPVNGIQLHLKEYRLSWGREQGLQVKQHLTLDDVDVCIHYRLHEPLQHSQTELFHQLQELLLRPLINAIDYDQISRQAMFDALTHLGNRRYYNEMVKQTIARSQRNGEPFALVVLDLDNFKTLNDQHGHLIGDDVLLSFAQTLQQAIRESELAFRIGGDEFAVLINGDTDDASVLCQRVLQMVDSNNLLNRFNVQTSIGVAQWQTQQSSSELYFNADKALYQAKAAGRRCYRIAASV